MTTLNPMRLLISLSMMLAGAALADAPKQAAAERPKPPGGTLCGGPYKLVAADFTGDGKIDVAMAYLQVGAVTLEQGNGQGEFSNVGILAGAKASSQETKGVSNITSADIDKDGKLDLAFGVSGTPPGNWHSKPAAEVEKYHRGDVVVARNMGDGKFEPKASFPVPSDAKAVGLADLNKDGQIDLLYTARGSGYTGDLKLGRLYIRQGLGDWKFGDAIEFEAGPSAYYVELADLNNDGFTDVLVPNEHGVTVQIWLNPGSDIFAKPGSIRHSFVKASPIPGRRAHAVNDVRAADVNSDGNADLITANLGTNTISIFFGKGDGTFHRDVLLDGGVDPAFLAVGDVDNDKDMDFVITSWTQNHLRLFLNRGDGSFFPGNEHKTGLGNYGVVLSDVDADGKLDAVTANYRERSISFLKGGGDGRFSPAVTSKKGLYLFNSEFVPE